MNGGKVIAAQRSGSSATFQKKEITAGLAEIVEKTKSEQINSVGVLSISLFLCDLCGREKKITAEAEENRKRGLSLKNPRKSFRTQWTTDVRKIGAARPASSIQERSEKQAGTQEGQEGQEVATD